MNVKLCRPKQSDLPEIKVFFENVITDTFKNEGVGHLHEFICNEINEKVKYFEEDIKTNGLNRFYLVLKNEKEIIATAGFGPPGPSVLETCDNSITSLNEIGAVFVHPEYQGKGFGSLILNAIHSAALSRGIKQVMLDSGYKKAQIFWTKKLGMPTKIIKDYWDVGVDHMIWVYDIEDIYTKVK